MNQFSFSALGTEWCIQVDDRVGEGGQNKISNQLQQHILETTEQFDQQFSRFIPTSEANIFRNATAGTYPISKKFATFLQVCQQLQKDTNGAFDPAVGQVLELAGYNPDYNFQPGEDLTSFQLPTWKVRDQELTISGPVVFDTGGIGKGYWIDQLAKILRKHYFSHYIVEGGGDMVATTKQDGAPWRVALEWPGDSERVVGTVDLGNQGLAVSDMYRRKWGKWHHLINVKKLQPTQEVIWCAAIAKNAWEADQFTSILSLADSNLHAQLAKKRKAEYLVLHKDGQMHVSQNWPGEIF